MHGSSHGVGHQAPSAGRNWAPGPTCGPTNELGTGCQPRGLRKWGLAFLLDGRNHVPRVRRFEGHDVELIDMPYGERNIWGATADMLLTLYRLLRGEDA